MKRVCLLSKQSFLLMHSCFFFYDAVHGSLGHIVFLLYTLGWHCIKNYQCYAHLPHICIQDIQPASLKFQLSFLMNSKI